jgi:hypothetical protein
MRPLSGVRIAAVSFVVLLLAAGCGVDTEPAREREQLLVVSTFSIIGDFVEAVAGGAEVLSRVEVSRRDQQHRRGRGRQHHRGRRADSKGRIQQPDIMAVVRTNHQTVFPKLNRPAIAVMRQMPY